MFNDDVLSIIKRNNAKLFEAAGLNASKLKRAGSSRDAAIAIGGLKTQMRADILAGKNKPANTGVQLLKDESKEGLTFDDRGIRNANNEYLSNNWVDTPDGQRVRDTYIGNPEDGLLNSDVQRQASVDSARGLRDLASASSSRVERPSIGVGDENKLFKMAHGGMPEDALLNMGGPVRDPNGAPQKDTVDAKLAKGEYVLPAKTVEALGGPAVLDNIAMATNDGKEPVGVRKGKGLRMHAAAGGPAVPGITVNELDPRAVAKVQAAIAAENSVPKGGITATSTGWSSSNPQDMKEFTESRKKAIAAHEAQKRAAAVQRAAAAATEAPKSVGGFRQAVSGKHTTQVKLPSLDTVKNVLKKAPIGEAARFGAAASGLEGAYTGYNTDTEDYARRLNIDAPDSLLGNLALRTAGVASDVGASAVNGLMLPVNLVEHGFDTDKWYDYRNNFNDVQAAKARAAAPQPQANTALQDAAQQFAATDGVTPEQLAENQQADYAAKLQKFLQDNASAQTPDSAFAAPSRREATKMGLRDVQTLGASDSGVVVGRDPKTGQRTMVGIGGDANPAVMQREAARVARYNKEREEQFNPRRLATRDIEQAMSGNDVAAARALKREELDSAERQEATKAGKGDATAKTAERKRELERREEYIKDKMSLPEIDPETGKPTGKFNYSPALRTEFEKYARQYAAKEGINVDDLTPQQWDSYIMDALNTKEIADRFNSRQRGLGRNGVVLDNPIHGSQMETYTDDSTQGLLQSLKGGSGNDLGTWNQLMSFVPGSSPRRDQIVVHTDPKTGKKRYTSLYELVGDSPLTPEQEFTLGLRK